jgi:hypothetical protein
MNNGTRPQDQPAVGIGGTRNVDLTKPAAAAPASSHETLDGHHLGDAGRTRAHGSRSAATDTGKNRKICCACGKDVAHEERFKDRQGYYWCMDCGVQENRVKHTIGHAPDAAACPDCTKSFPQDQLVAFERLRLCAECADKRQKHAAREAARKAAVAQEALDAERRRRHVLIGSAVAAAVVVAWLAYVML